MQAVRERTEVPPVRMLSRSSSLLPLALVWLAGCANAPPPANCVVLEQHVAMPAEVVAAIVSGALRRELPFCDPVRAAGGVLAQAVGSGHWRVGYCRRGGEWHAIASHRLVVACSETGDLHTQATALSPEETSARPSDPEFRLEVHATANGCTLRGSLPALLAPSVSRAMALAQDPCTAVPGLDEPMLAAFALHRLLAMAQLADHDGDVVLAHSLRQRGARLSGATAALHAALASHALRTGDAQQAADHGWHALLATRDVQLRSTLSQHLTGLAAVGVDALAWRTAARTQLQAGHAESSAALLHTAQRLLAEPTLDYRLLSQAHRLQHDDHAAHANALLAREHAGLHLDLVTFAAELWSLPAAVRPAMTLRTPTAATAAAPAR